MNSIRNVFLCLVLVAVNAVLTGCATTTTARPMATEPLPPPAFVPPGPQYGPAPVVTAPVPPGRPETTMGPPQSWAWLHSPPHGCERGPFSLAIINGTDYFMQVSLDGEDLQIRGSGGVLPHLPPGAIAYVCLAHLENHTINGVAFAPRYGTLYEVPGDNGRFTATVRFGTPPNASGRNEFPIHAALMILQ